MGRNTREVAGSNPAVPIRFTKSKGVPVRPWRIRDTAEYLSGATVSARVNDFASFLEFLAAPIGVAILSALAFVYLFNMGDCNAITAEGGANGTCMTRIGIEVSSTFDPTKAAAGFGTVVGFGAGIVAYIIRD